MTTLLELGVRSPVLLVGLCGDAGCGKDTFAEPFHSHNFRQYSFAAPLKDACAAAFGIHRSNFDSRTLKNEKIPYWGMTPVEMLQFVGTELFRDSFGLEFWISRLNYQLCLDWNPDQEQRVVISDVRFQNEAQWILDLGGSLIRLTRPGNDGNVGIQNHRSKNGIIWETLRYPKDRNAVFRVVNSGTIAELHQEADKFISCQLKL